jgi:hypothetical protein
VPHSAPHPTLPPPPRFPVRRRGLGALLLPWLLLPLAGCGAQHTAGAPTPGVRLASAEGRLAPVAPPFRLVDTAAEKGLVFTHQVGTRAPLTIVETMGSGCAFLDFDNDGWQDVLMVSAGPDYQQPEQPSGTRLFRNRGGTFEDVTARAGLNLPGYLMGACAGDFDNDGHTDLFLTGFGRNYLLRNRGDGTFVDVTAAAGILRRKDAWGMGCAFVDVNRDGKLDLYVANYVVFDPAIPLCRSGSTMSGCTPNQYQTQRNELYMNLGNGRFAERAVVLGADDPAGAGLGVTVLDFDNDGWPDIFVANDGTPNALLHNRGGKFENIGDQSGLAYAEAGVMRAGMGCDAADYDGDGLLDITITNFQHEPNSLYRYAGNLLFEETTYPSGYGSPSVMRLGFGVAFGDLDGDGRPDIYVGNGHVYDNVAEFDDTATFEQPDLLFLNRGEGRLEEVSPATGAFPGIPSVARGVAMGDFNNDGAPDVLINSLARPVRLLENRPASPRRWLGLVLRGTRSNRNGIGARIEVRGPGGLQVREVRSGGSYLAQGDLRPLFRFGEHAEAGDVAVSIRWPSGTVQQLRPANLDTYLAVQEPAGPTPPGEARR